MKSTERHRIKEDQFVTTLQDTFERSRRIFGPDYGTCWPRDRRS